MNLRYKSESVPPDFDAAKAEHASFVLKRLQQVFETRRKNDEPTGLDDCLQDADIAFEEFAWAEGYAREVTKKEAMAEEAKRRAEYYAARSQEQFEEMLIEERAVAVLDDDEH